VTRTLVDSHLHSWELARHPQPWIDPESMPEIDRDFTIADAATTVIGCGVAGAVVVQALNSTQETLDLLAGASSSSSVLGVVGWVDLIGDVPAQLAELRSAPGGSALVGIRHLAHLESDPSWLLRLDVSAGIDAVVAAGLPFDVVIRAHQLPVAAQLADHHPHARLVLDHLGKPPLLAGGADLDRWTVDLAELARRDNLVAKVSGLTIEDDWKAWTPGRLAGVVEEALAAFGVDRLMFGSDWPLVNLTGGYVAWLDAYLGLTAGLSPDEQAIMDGVTARGVYGLADG
jgi:L-fuconolactonase